MLLVVCGWAGLARCQWGHECSSTVFTSLVTPQGYTVEEHNVMTADGYRLRVFRMQGKGQTIQSGKPVVILQHGNEDSSDNWVLNDEERSPGFFLANRGFDVWLPNNRGNKYSMTHSKLARWEKKFWDFSFQEMGTQDQPAIVEYILRATGEARVTYIGHSQGTTQMFAGLSDPLSKDYLNAKVKKFIALAPVVYTTACTNKLLNNFAKYPWVLGSSDLMGQYQLFPAGCSTDTAQEIFMRYLCNQASWLCVKYVSGGDPDRFHDNVDRIHEFLSHSPSGASVRCFQHFVQMFSEPKAEPQLRMFDFGAYENRKRYGQEKPPVYDFSNIRVPVALFVGLQDTLGSPTDNRILLENLRRAGVSVRDYFYDRWGHMTFTWGKDVASYLEDLLREVRG